jgi:hypothetical protein
MLSLWRKVSLDLRLCTKIDIDGPGYGSAGRGVSDLVQVGYGKLISSFAIWRFQEMVPVFTGGESSSSVRNSRHELD